MTNYVNYVERHAMRLPAQVSGRSSAFGKRLPAQVSVGSQDPSSNPPKSQEISAVDILTASCKLLRNRFLIMDWLEVITTTMQDLSDGSAEWWSRVRALASEAYSRWTSASPVEKLSILPPREDALENGKWSRVNSRAASMVLMAVPSAVKQELVQHRSTGSVTSCLGPLAEEMSRVGGGRTGQLQNFPRQESSSQSTAKSEGETSERTAEEKAKVPCKFFAKTYKGKNHSAKDCPNKKGNASVEQIPARSTSSSATTGSDQVDLKEVLADVGKMLKAMTATNLKAMRVKEGNDHVLEDFSVKRASEETFGETENTGLLDSGASHPMRPAEHDEYARGQPVRVTLAGEDVRILRQNDPGTILVQESNPSIQPIVPLGAVIENLGYTLHWSPKSLRLVHPSKKAIQVKIKNHCPEVAAVDALNLIQELEMKNVQELNVQVESLQARLEVIKKEETREWWELLKEYTKTGERPVLLKAILTSPITKNLPTDVQIAPPLTQEEKSLDVVEELGKIVLDVDLAKSRLWDFGYYCVPAPPILANVLGTNAGSGGKRNVGFLMEMPADAEYLRRDVTYDASVWKTEMWKNFSSVSGIKEISFYMGTYGHKASRPTTMATTYPALIQLEPKGLERIKRTPSTLLDPKEMRRWSIPFKEIVAEAIADYHSGCWSEEEEIVKAGAQLNKLTRELREAWHRRLMNDHQPYRADCSVCINAQATGYQHRRRLHPTMYTMALDLAGPFKQKGRDMDHDDYKYIMVAAYRCPKEYMNEKALAELDMDLYVPDEPSEVEGRDPMEVVGEAPSVDEGVSDLDDEEENHEPEAHGPETMDDAVEALAHPEEWVFPDSPWTAGPATFFGNEAQLLRKPSVESENYSGLLGGFLLTAMIYLFNGNPFVYTSWEEATNQGYDVQVLRGERR
ncbi:unnamed protein product [Symbiodinium sp. KB8]|nr:unnamed protein product [Symbiodinium sp. KB8]